MRRRMLPLAWFTLSLLAAGAASAGQVVEFTDGRYLEIARYEPIEDFVRLDLGRGSFLVIPQSQVDAIREGRRELFTPDGRLTDPPPREAASPAPVPSTFVVRSGQTLPPLRGVAG